MHPLIPSTCHRFGAIVATGVQRNAGEGDIEGVFTRWLLAYGGDAIDNLRSVIDLF